MSDPGVLPVSRAFFQLNDTPLPYILLAKLAQNTQRLPFTAHHVPWTVDGLPTDRHAWSACLSSAHNARATTVAMLSSRCWANALISATRCRGSQTVKRWLSSSHEAFVGSSCRGGCDDWPAWKRSNRRSARSVLTTQLRPKLGH